jgi:hypothetical protein
VKQIIRFLLNIVEAAQDLLARMLYTNRMPELLYAIIETKADEKYLMSDPEFEIGSHVEHVHEEWSGEVIGLIFDEGGAIESISVWLEDGDVVDDPIEYWDHIESELLPDNVIEATNRFMKKK